MADAKATFAVELEDQTSAPADQAASALARLKDKIEADTKALREMQAAMGRLKGNTLDVKNAKEELLTKINATKNSLGVAQAGYLKMGGNLADIGKKSQVASAATMSLGSAFGSVPGPVGDVSNKLGALKGLLTSPAGIIAGATLLVGILAIGVAALFGFSVATADAARTNGIFLSAVAGSDAAGAKLGGTISALSNRIPVAKDQLQAMAVSLSDAGLQGKNLERALSAAGTATAVLGAGAGSKLQALASKAAETGKLVAKATDFKGTGVALEDVSRALAKNLGIGFDQAKRAIESGAVDMADGVKALDDAVQSKLGKHAADLNISLPAIANRAKAAFAGLFSGVKIESLLRGLSDLVDMFGEGKAVGDGLRLVVSTMMTPLSDWLGSNGGGAKAFFKGMVIACLEVVLWALKIRNAFKGAFGGLPPIMLPAGTAMAIVRGLAMGLVVGIAMLAAVVLVMAQGVKVGIGSLMALGRGALAAYNAFKGVSWGSLGTALIDGLVKGIKEGAQKVVDAVKGLATGALDAGKEALGIQSPSKKFAQLGRFSAQGMAQGVEQDTPLAEKAIRGLVSVPGDAASASSSTSAAGGASSRGAVNVRIDAVYIGGSPADSSTKAQVTAWFVELLEDAVRMSGGPAPEPAT